MDQNIENDAGSIDGLELANRVARGWPSTRILLMTGFAGADCKVMYPVLHKPFTPHVLAEHVLRICQSEREAAVAR